MGFIISVLGNTILLIVVGAIAIAPYLLIKDTVRHLIKNIFGINLFTRAELTAQEISAQRVANPNVNAEILQAAREGQLRTHRKRPRLLDI